MKWWLGVWCVGAWLLLASNGKPVLPLEDGALGAAATAMRPFSGTGRVLSAQGTPLSEVNVTLQSPEGDAWYERVVTDAEGRFSFTKKPARFSVAARHSLGEVTTRALAATELVEAGSDPLVLVLVPPVELGGSVVDLNGDAVANAQLSLARAGNADADSDGPPASTTPRSWATSDVQGRFALLAPAPGDYLMKVWAPGFVPRELLVELTGANGAERIELTPFRDVRGVVVDPNGMPVADAVVLACDAATELTTAADGSFVLPVGTVGCSAFAQHPRFSASATKPVRGGRDLRFELQPGGAIRGTVTDPSGRFAPDVRLEIIDYSPPEGAYRFPLERFSESLRVIREFRFGPLSPGTYTLRAFRRGDEEGSYAVIVDSGSIEVGPGATARGVHLIVPPSESTE